MKTSLHKHDLKPKKAHWLHFSSRDNYQIIKCCILAGLLQVLKCRYFCVSLSRNETYIGSKNYFPELYKSYKSESLCRNNKHTDNGNNSIREYGRYFYSPKQKEQAIVTLSILIKAWSCKWILNRYITNLLMTLMKQSSFSSSANMKKIKWI